MTKHNLAYPKRRDRFVPHPDMERNDRSVRYRVRQILGWDRNVVTEEELKQELSMKLWNLTEGPRGRWKFTHVRYASEGFLSDVAASPRHEHVVTRKSLVARLLAGEDFDTVLDDAIACLVTKEEAQRLNRATSEGWDRYREVGVIAYDMATGDRIA